MFGKLKTLLFGFDITIIYTDGPATDYAETLANYLSKDEFKNLLQEWDDTFLKRKQVISRLNSSSVIVVLATKELAHSASFDTYMSNLNEQHKKIITIDIGHLNEATWSYLLKKQKIVTEKNSFVENAKPSNKVFNAITEASTFRTKNKTLNRAALLSASLVIICIFIILGGSFYINYQIKEVIRNKKTIEESASLAESSKIKADQAVRKATENEQIASHLEKMAKANALGSLSLAISSQNPTKALRIAQEAFQLFDEKTDTLTIPVTLQKAMYDSYYNSWNNKTGFYTHDLITESAVNDIDLSPNGKMVIGGTKNGFVKLWDFDKKEVRDFKGHAGEVHTITFSPSGLRILTGSQDRSAKLWDLNGNLLKDLDEHDEPVVKALFSPKNSRIITLTDDSLRLWNTEGELISLLNDRSDLNNDVAFSPVEKKFATASDQIINIWDFNGKPGKILRGHLNDVNTVTFSINGSRIITTSNDSTAIIWNKTGKMIRHLIGHNGAVNDGSFSPDRRKIVTVSDDQTAKLWTWNGTFVKTMKGHTKPVTKVTFSPDASLIATVSLDHTVKVWDNNGNLVLSLVAHKSHIKNIIFSSDSKKIFTGSSDGSVKVWPLHRSLVKSWTFHTDGVLQSHYLPDQQSIITLSGAGILRMWDQNGQRKELRIDPDEATHDFHLDDQENIITISNGKVQTIDLKGKLVKDHIQLTDSVVLTRLFKERKVFAALTKLNHLKIYSDKMDLRREIKLDTSLIVNDFTLSNDQKILLATRQGLVLADENGIKPIDTIKQNISKIIVSPSEKLLLTLDVNGSLRLFSDELKVIRDFDKFNTFFTSATFSPSGDVIYAGTREGKVKVFTKEGSLITGIALHSKKINQLSVTKDGKFLITSSDDNRAMRCFTALGIYQWLKTTDLAPLTEEETSDFGTPKK